jgi:hypothetical protein
VLSFVLLIASIHIKKKTSQQIFMYQCQKVHLFRPSLSFLAEAQPRLENRRGQKAPFERTIIGFVGFVANLLNSSTHGATVSVRKRVTFRPLSLKVPKK